MPGHERPCEGSCGDLVEIGGEEVGQRFLYRELFGKYFQCRNVILGNKETHLGATVEVLAKKVASPGESESRSVVSNSL